MKWNDITKKEPPFDTELLIWVDNDWKVGQLTEIRNNSRGKEYEFEFGFDQSISTKVTHWLIPEKPKLSEPIAFKEQ